MDDYKKRERDYLIKVIADAGKEWYLIKTIIVGEVFPRYHDHIADAVIAAGFGYRREKEDGR